MPVYPAAGHPAAGVNIEAWTAETLQSLSTLHISAATVPVPQRATTVALEIPLDVDMMTGADQGAATGAGQAGLARRASYKRREPVRRDSLKRRELLLRGKEGSRRRQKWENGIHRSGSSTSAAWWIQFIPLG